MIIYRDDICHPLPPMALKTKGPPWGGPFVLHAYSTSKLRDCQRRLGREIVLIEIEVMVELA